MSRFELLYVHRVVDRYGKVRFYFRRKGYPRCPLPGEPLSIEFMAAYHAALAQGDVLTQGPQSAAVPGSIGWLIERYYVSPTFAQLGPTTRQTYRRILEGLREEHGHRLVKKLQRKNIIAMHNAKAATPDAANSLLKLLRGLIDWPSTSSSSARTPPPASSG